MTDKSLAISEPEALVSGAQPLASGHQLSVDAAASALQITNAHGQVELVVRCTPQGCVVQLGSGDVRLASQGKLSIDCEALEVRARQNIGLSSPEGALHVQTDSLHLRATRGDAVVEANDRVRLIGEQIRLNSEHATEPPAGELRALWKRMGIE
jgi:hypothetical protein